MKPVVVLLSFHYPPMLGPASQRAASFARYLPENGWEPIVITVSHGHYPMDERHRPPAVRTIRTRSPEPSRMVSRLRGPTWRGGGGGAEVPSDAGFAPTDHWARRFVRDYLYLPDGQTLWIPVAVRTLLQVLTSVPGPKILMSSSVPYSAHLAALAATRHQRVPWIAEFRDPWSQIDERIRPRSRVRREIDRRLERRVVYAASALVVTSEMTREAMMGYHPNLGGGDIWVVRNGFEEFNERPPPPPSDGRLELVQAGSVPDDAPIEPLLDGIDRIAGRDPGAIRLKVFGAPERWRAAAASRHFEWLELAGFVPPDVARSAIASASANLLLRPGEQHREYVAAKLMEYLGARRPILAVVDPNGEMATLGRRYGDVQLVPEYCEDSVAQAVEQLLARQRSGALNRPARPHRPLEELTRRTQASRLATVLDSLLVDARDA
jgi:glycosyltransferase involved in cell wall biosynthesis